MICLLKAKLVYSVLCACINLQNFLDLLICIISLYFLGLCNFEVSPLSLSEVEQELTCMHIYTGMVLDLDGADRGVDERG